MKPRLQFTIRGLLWATFWVAVSMTAWMLVATFDSKYWWWPYTGIAGVVCPFIVLAMGLKVPVHSSKSPLEVFVGVS